jgi:hypothetical protein
VTFIGPTQQFLLRGAAGQDNYISYSTASSVNNKNFGFDPELLLDNSATAVSFPLIKFDLSSVPADAKLVYADLVLSVSTPPSKAFMNTRGTGTITKGTAQISIHKMLQDWGIGSGTAASPSSNGVTWDMADKSNNTKWNTPTPVLPAYNIAGTPFINSDILSSWNDGTQGGNYDASADAQYPNYVPYNKVEFFDSDGVTQKIFPGKNLSWDITPIMAEWLASPTENYGLLVRADSALSQAKFHSFNAVGVPIYEPRIEMAYWRPCGSAKPPTVSNDFLPINIYKNQQTVLTITLSNPNATPFDITTVNDALPANLAVVAGSLSTTCPAGASAPVLSSVLDGTTGITTLKMTGGRIPANGSCTLSATIKPNVAGTFTNTIKPGEVITTAGLNNAFFASSSLLTVQNSTISTLTATADTAIWKTGSLANSNCGVCAELAASTPNANQVNSLYRFDLSGIPATATVSNAKLRLYVTQIVNRTAGQALTLQASPVTASWVEGTDNVVTSTGGATWKKRSTALGNWATQGGDFSAVNAATATIPGSFVGTLGSGMWIEFDVTAAAQAMVSNTATNFGFHVQDTTVTVLSNEVRLAARENTTPAGTAPQLVVTYQ